MSGLVQIHLCCNNPENGMFDGLCRGITLADSEALTLESPFLDRHLKCEIGRNYFRLGKSRTWGHHGHQQWVGNWCWDSLAVIPSCAADVLNFAISKNYQVMVVSGALIDKTANGELITAADLWRAIQ